MADVIITLPRALWMKITSGVKSVECRKNFPKIGIKYGRVWVVEKGTHYVRGYFTIQKITRHNNYNAMWAEYGSEIAVDYTWFNNYAKTAKNGLYLWHINHVYECEGNIDLEEYFGVKHNPQSFIYCPFEPYCRATLVRFRNPQTGRIESPTLFSNNKRNSHGEKGGTVVPPSDLQSEWTKRIENLLIAKKTIRPCGRTRAQKENLSPQPNQKISHLCNKNNCPFYNYKVDYCKTCTYINSDIDDSKERM